MSPRGLDAPAVRRRLTEMARLLDGLDSRAPAVLSEDEYLEFVLEQGEQ